MHVTRTIVAAVLLVIAMVGVPLAAVAVANSVQPVIPAVSAAGPGPAADLPAMPDPPATVRPLTTWFERLPLVEDGSGATPRPFVTRYREVPLRDRAAATALIDVAFDGIRVEDTAQPSTRALLDALIRPTTDDETGSEDDDGDAEVTGTFDTPAFKALSEPAMTAIAADPSNAQAVNDLAVAIATTWLSEPANAPSVFEPNPTVRASPELQEAATKLLELGLESFPDDREMTINLAYLRSLETSTDEFGVQVFADKLAPAIAGLQRYVDGAPTDSTAASLLANLTVLTDPEHGLEPATAIAAPLIGDPDSEPAGQIIRGDSLLFAADRDRTESPFLARSYERRALDAYDRAIALTGDAGAYAGRARALDVLGARDAALEAQREAVRRTPASVAWRLRLAQLEGCTDGLDAWGRDASLAQSMATVPADTSQAMLATRNILGKGLDLDAPEGPGLDFGRFSIGSDLLAWDATIRDQATSTSISALDPFPEPVACITGEPTVSEAIGDAAFEVALAAMAQGDMAAARAAVSPWYDDPADTGDEEGEEGGEEGEEGGESASEVPEGEEAALAAGVLGLVAGDALEEGDTTIVEFMPLASRLPPTAQARICEDLSRIRGLTQEDLDALTLCAAEAADRTGDHEAAARAIEPAIRLDDPSNPTIGSTALKAGMLSELTGHLDTARLRYETAAASSGTSIGGLVRLGDLDLRENDASGALDHYALAAAAIRTQASAADEIQMTDGLAGRLAQYVDNNRGIALLMTARTETDAPPDCVAFPSECREAADAFAAAMAADPLNPVYTMNAAWVARLTGDADRATALIDQALELGIPLVAAANNDLGVIAAQGGDFDGARAKFVKAIAADPDYDLATWNLGVLDSRRAGTMILAGQALLAKATELNPDLITKPLAFMSDERVYRVDVSGTELELARAPGTGAAVGAAAFGAIATLGAIGQLISGLGSDAQAAAETVANEGAGRAGRRLRGIGGRLPGRGRGWPTWAAWIPAILVLTVTTAWTANWMAPDAFVTAVLIGLAAAAVAMVVHVCGHMVVAGRLGATVRPSGWTPGLALAVVGMPFYVPAGPFLAERIETGDPRRDWWVSFAGIAANLAAAGIVLLIYLAEPMPFLRILVATQLAVAAFALIPSNPLDGDRLSTKPIVLALMAFGVAAASTAIAVGAI